VRNWRAVAALLVALLALAVLFGAGYLADTRGDVSWLQAAAAVPVAGLLSLFSLSLSGRARALHQRTLGRAGGSGLARVARFLGLLGLLLALTAALALGVFAVLETTDGLTKTPW
jgi:hypothetical protein